MSATIREDIDPPFELVDPERPVAPVIFNSPHSGRVYPSAFLARVRLDLPTLRRSEDFFVDELFAPAADLSLAVMRAHFPRCFVDLNREPYELDPRMFEDRLPAFANTRSMRVAGGLGTVPRVVGDALEIYDRRLPVAEALGRIETFYKPYHRTLRRTLTRMHRRFGVALLVDCHSMPSSAAGRDARSRADIVIGDRYGTSCAAPVADLVETTLRDLGYAVQRNRPYAGGFITEHYGNPALGLNAIQLEINRALYLDEGSYLKSARFERVAEDMRALAARLAAFAWADLVTFRAAAE